MGEIYIYEPGATDCSTQGLGILRPSRIVSRQRKNDFWEIEADVPMDPVSDSWRYITVGAKIRARASTRVIPDINMDDPDNPLRVTTVQVWRVKQTASHDERTLWKKANTDSGKIRRFALGRKVQVIKSYNADWYKVNTHVGKGYMLKSGLDYEIQQSIPDTNVGIESVLEPAEAEYQIFRITRVTKKIGIITIHAEHIFYDLARNITYYKTGQVTAGTAIAGVLDNCMAPHDFDFVTDTADIRSALDYTGSNAVAALLDPEKGVAGQYDLELVRNNYSFALLRRAGASRGAVIEYGKNMVSIQIDTDASDVITHVVPIGRNKGGGRMHAAHDRSGWAIVSPEYQAHPERYPVQSWAEIDYSNQGCQVTDEVSEATVRAELARLGALEFTQNHVDIPSYKVRVKFIDVGDTIQFSQYKGLDSQYHLYDWVQIRHPDLIDGAIEAEIVEETEDLLTGTVTEIQLDSATKSNGYRKIPSWEVPAISGDILLSGTIPPGKLQDGAVGESALGPQAVTPSKIDLDALASDGTFVGALEDELALWADGKITLAVGRLAVGSRNYIRNSRTMNGGNFSIVSATDRGVFQDGTALHVVYGVTATQSSGGTLTVR